MGLVGAPDTEENESLLVQEAETEGIGCLSLGDRLNKPILEISLTLKKGMSPPGRVT